MKLSRFRDRRLSCSTGAAFRCTDGGIAEEAFDSNFRSEETGNHKYGLEPFELKLIAEWPRNQEGNQKILP